MDVPYEQVTPPNWSKDLANVPWVPVKDKKGHVLARKKTLRCPRCQDPIDIRIGGIVGALPFTASCNCGRAHAPMASGDGCGAFGPATS